MPMDIALANTASGICGCMAGVTLGRRYRRERAAQQPDSDQEERPEPAPVEEALCRVKAAETQTDLSACDFLVPTTPLRPDESARLQRLCELQALGLESGHLLDEITSVLGWLCNMPVVLVSLVTAKKLCFASRFGLEGRQAPREEHSLCAWCISPWKPEVLVVEDASKDGRTCRSGIVAGPPHVRFYAGCPLQTSDGFPLGTLCLIDQVPRSISVGISQLLVNFAEIVSRNLEKFDLESVELPSQRVPVDDNQEEIPQEPPKRESFQRGPLRLDRVCKSFGDAHLMVLASPHTTKWPVLWTDGRWQKLTNTSVLPPSKLGESACMDTRLQFWDVATWIDDCGVDEQRGGVRRPDAYFAEQIQDGAVFRLPVLLKSVSEPNGIEAVARCVPADLPLDTNAAAIAVEPTPESTASGAENWRIEEGYKLYFFVIRPCEEPKKRKLQAISELSVREASTTLLKDVELKQLVGSGSFGKVYLGDWIGAQVAVKVLHRVPHSNQPGSAFEACLSSALWHPNIVQTFEHCTREVVTEPDETVARLIGLSKDKKAESLRMYETMIVQDWCDGGTLSKRIEERHPLGPCGGGFAELVADVSDIASALAYMHDRDIVHGDLSANNVLLATRPTARGHVCKVCDFGLARAVGGEAAVLRKLAAAQATAPCEEASLPTLLGGQWKQTKGDEKHIFDPKATARFPIENADAAFVRGFSPASEPESEPIADKERQKAAVISTQSLGTVQYMPPEMLSISTEPALSAKVDMYSLGIIAWQLATGKVPWEGCSPPQVVIRINRGKRLTLTEEEAPADIVEVVDKCTAREPDDRPQARRLVKALAEIVPPPVSKADVAC